MAGESIQAQLTDIKALLAKIGPSSDQASLDALAASVKAIGDTQGQIATRLDGIASFLGLDDAQASGASPSAPPPPPSTPLTSATVAADNGVASYGSTIATPL